MSGLNVPVMPRGRGAQWQQPGTPSDATDDAGQGRQFHTLLPIVVANFAGSSEGSVGSVSFRVFVPDSRLRTKIVLLPVRTVSGFTLQGKGLTLWLRETEPAKQTGTYEPITNLWGTGAAPGPIPGTIDPATGLPVADANLQGFGKEFVTAGRAIEGTITYAVINNSGKGQIILQVEYTPEAIRFPRNEWQEIVAEMGMQVLTPIPLFES